MTYRLTNRFSIMVAGIIMMLCLGVCNLWNILMPESLEYYGWPSSSATIVHSVLFASTVLGNIVGGWLNDHIGSHRTAYIGWALFFMGFIVSSLIRQSLPGLLYLTYSFTVGFGSGLCYCSIITSTQKWWANKKGMASGIVVCAYGLSVTILSPIAEGLFSKGLILPDVFRIFGIAFGLIVGVGCLFIYEPPGSYVMSQLGMDENNAAKSEDSELSKDITVREILRNKNYYKLLYCMIFGAPMYSMLNAQFKMMGVIRGLNEKQAIYAVMLTGIGSACGRFLIPRLADRIGSKRVMLLDFSCVFVITFFMLFARNTFYTVCIFCLSVIYGGGAAMTPVLASDCFGFGRLGTNYSMLMVSALINAAIFPTLGGYLVTDGITTAWTFIIPMILEITGIYMIHTLKFSNINNRKVNMVNADCVKTGVN